MTPSNKGDARRDDAGLPVTPHSARVRLEVAFLDADEAAPIPAPLSTHDERPRITALVVAAEPDVRRYVRECVAQIDGLHVLEAASAAAGVAVAALHAPDLLVIDESEAGGLASLAHVNAIVIVDDIPHGAPQPPGRRLLARPFSTGDLMAEVRRLITNDA